VVSDLQNLRERTAELVRRRAEGRDRDVLAAVPARRSRLDVMEEAVGRALGLERMAWQRRAVEAERRLTEVEARLAALEAKGDPDGRIHD
jgi:hypothetical protein